MSGNLFGEQSVGARRQVEDQERQELLARRAGQGGAASWRRDPDEEAQTASFVQNSKRALEEAFETGTAALASMSGQRERLKASAPQCLRSCHGLQQLVFI